MPPKPAPAAARNPFHPLPLPPSPDDMCPVCKTIRYLNRDMEFLINPECYHTMCLNCVNRLFTDGPNQCPYAGCNRTLRRKGFRSAFFSDLSVEREVDVRRRVAAVFNRVEDDFETARDWDNYLQMVEELTFDLVHGGAEKRGEAEKVLVRWEGEHKGEIERNRRAGREREEQARRRMGMEREAARERRVAALREVEEEREERRERREAELDGIASGGGGGGGGVQLKRRGQVVRAVEQAAAGMAEVGRLSIRGLKEKKTRGPEGPYDPFGGMDFVPSRYRLGEGLAHPQVDKYRFDQGHVTGGYSFEEWTARAMYEAFAGLGVFVEDEKEAGIGLSSREIATIASGIAAVGDKMELD